MLRPIEFYTPDDVSERTGCGEIYGMYDLETSTISSNDIEQSAGFKAFF